MQNDGFKMAVRLLAATGFAALALAGAISLVSLQAGWLVFDCGADAPIEQPKDDKAGGPDILRSTGSVEVWSESIPVDTSKVYDVEMTVKVIPKSGERYSDSRFFLGVATYDENGDELRSGPGTYRYAGGADVYVTSLQGWVKLAGSITNEGDETHAQFRPGTRSVRVVALVRNNGVTTDLSNVTFTPRLTLISKPRE